MRPIIRLLAPLALLLAMLLPAGGATAAPAQTERTETFVFQFNTCNGEFVAGDGIFHTVFKPQKDGGFIAHFNINATGAGNQGNEYVMNWVGKSRFVPSPSDFSFQERFLAISKGSAPNQVIISRFDGDGIPTFEVECRG
ncbi:hypothetical protein [Arthrobacter globiformis]|jgi:hypothetical protein|uniref:hypothetical protein n=1 Tax=Arthrobacter globiformis TaxID=1665 RepID=UPI002790287A|nr:hypothetical protein [Arthrobacter globiformis]MDQ0618079.1 hypothetical protein [Arthrobacter globiformis]